MQRVTIHNPDDYIDFDEFVRGEWKTEKHRRAKYKLKLIDKVKILLRTIEFYRCTKSEIAIWERDKFCKENNITKQQLENLSHRIKIGKYKQ